MPTIPLPLIALAVAGGLSALAGGYWDDAWHTERGRDSFFIAPHIAIYAGIAATGAALVLWALLVARAAGPRAALRHRPLTLGLAAVAVTLASGPIDNAWHEAFGRDSVIWSPPHMLGIVGTLAIAAALLGARADASDVTARVAGGMVLAAATFSVAEYETDVPQFDVRWYLPVLVGSAAIALAIVGAATAGRWAATTAAAVHLAFLAALAGALSLGGFPGPALPLLVVPAVVVDLAARRGWGAGRTGTAFAVALVAVVAPARTWLGDGIELSFADAVVGVALGAPVAALAFALAAGGTVGNRPARGGVVVALLLLVAAPVALAHDPGQGEPAGTLALTITRDGDRATLDAVLSQEDCRRTVPRAVVARRASVEHRARLRRRGCRLLSGSVAAPGRGRWFIYAELERDGRAVEAWLPVRDGVASDPARYAYTPPETTAGVAKTVGGVLLYLVMAALLAATLRLVRARD